MAHVRRASVWRVGDLRLSPATYLLEGAGAPGVGLAGLERPSRSARAHGSASAIGGRLVAQSELRRAVGAVSRNGSFVALWGLCRAVGASSRCGGIVAQSGLRRAVENLVAQRSEERRVGKECRS